VEQALGIFLATLTAADEAEVRDHLPLELIVSKLPKEEERLLEVLNGHRDASAGMNEREGEVVERQRLGAAVAQLAHDRKGGAVLLHGLFVIALPSKLRAELVVSMRAAAAVVCGRLPPMILQEGVGPTRNAVRGAVGPPRNAGRGAV
jgi:hypothetical protein